MTNLHKNQMVPPLSFETLKEYAKKVFEPINRGENVTVIWVAMAGRRIRNKFIIEYSDLFKNEIGEVKKYLLVYVEPLELTERSRDGFLKLLIKSIVESYNNQTKGNSSKLSIEEYLSLDSAETYFKLLDRLEKLIGRIISENRELVVFLGEFDEFEFADPVICNNLKAIWKKFEEKLHYVFLLLRDATRPDVIKQCGELNELLLQNVVYVPLLESRDINYLIDYFDKQFNGRFSQPERQLLEKVCGGHPYLLKSCSRIIALMDGDKLEVSELEKKLLLHFEPRSAAQKIFDYRDRFEKNFLRNITKHKVEEVPENVVSLAKLGIVKKDKSNFWQPFGQLFESCIKEGREGLGAPPKAETKLFFDETNGLILIDNESVEEKFTRQEYEVLKFFLKEPNKLKSRDEIGEAIWGEESYEKYSDWAIDQLMSKIRKKLGIFGAGETLVTVRGRGYKLILS